MGRRHRAATHIQACYRRHAVLRTLEALNTLATVIQSNFHGHRARKVLAQRGMQIAIWGLNVDQREDLAQRWSAILPGSPSPVKAAPPPASPEKPELAPPAPQVPSGSAMEEQPRQPQVPEKRREPLKKRRQKQRAPGETARSTSTAAGSHRAR